MPYELYNKVIGLLTEEKLKTTIKGGVKVAQILFSQNIDVLKIMSEKNIDPLLDEKVPLELIANAPNFEKIPQSVIDFYVGQTTTEQLLAPRSNSFDRTNVSYYLSMQPKLFDIYFKDDSLFKLLSEENKINIVNNFLSYPQEKSAEYLLNDKFDWPWEKSDVSYYRNNFFSFNEELKEKIEQKVEYIKAAQEKQKLENLFNDDIIIKEKEPIIPSKPEKRNKI